MKSQILFRLHEIEAEGNVRIVYACESGSRAWGFPSADSDYDIRLLYLHPVEWYLSLDVKRDVIERPVQDGLDKLSIQQPVAKEIAHLLAAKRAGVELDRGPRIETLSRFIEEALDRWEKNSVIHQKHPINSGKLDELFRTTLAKAWGYSNLVRGKRSSRPPRSPR